MMKNSTLISVIKIPLFAALFMPFFTGGGFSLDFQRVIYFRLMVEAALVLYVLLILRDSNYLPARTPLLLAVSAFVLSYLVSSMFSINPSKSFWGEPVRMGGFVTLVHFFAFFVIASSVFKQAGFRPFLKTSVAAAFLVTLFAVGQQLDIGIIPDFGKSKLHGTMGNAALLAGYILPNIFLAYFFIFDRKTSSTYRYFGYAFVSLAILSIYWTVVRGAWLALFAGSIYFAYSFLKNRALKRILVISAVILAVGLVAFSFYLKYEEKLPATGPFERLASTTTVISRLDGWQIAAAGWRESAKTTIIGLGPENFSAIYNKHFNPYFFFDFRTENYWDRAHNVFLEILSAQGIIGLLAFIFVLIYWKASASSFKEEEKNLLTILLISYVVHTFFIFDSASSYLMLFVILAFLQSGVKENLRPVLKPRVAVSRTALPYLAVVIVLISAYFINIKPLSASREFYKAKGLYAQDPKQSLEFAARAIQKNTPEKHTIRKEIASLISTKADFSSTPQDIDKAELDFIIKEMERDVAENRYDVFSYLYLGLLYNHYGRIFNDSVYFGKTEALMTSALKLFQSRQQVYYVLADAKIKNGKEDEGLKLLDQALELNPDAAESYWRLALGFKETGDSRSALKYAVKAEELVYHGTREYLPDLLKLIKIYIDGHADIQRVAYSYEQAIILRPNYAPFYASLATAYKELGEFEKAAYYARKTIELDPTFKKEAEEFIRSLNF